MLLSAKDFAFLKCTDVYVSIALNDIRKVFESKRTVQGYYTENVLQTRTDFRDDEWFQPFIELNSDAMAEVDSRVGTLHLAIEFDLAHKSHRSYRRKLNAYYIEGAACLRAHLWQTSPAKQRML